MSKYIHTTGRLKEVPRLKDENFEHMCYRILIKEGIIKDDDDYDIPQYHGVRYWSNLIEEELSDKYLTVIDWEIVDRLFEIVEKESERVKIEKNEFVEKETGEYTFDVIYDLEECSLQDIVDEHFPRTRV